MTLQEAIKSGKPFRRTSFAGYDHWKKFNIWNVMDHGLRARFFGKNEGEDKDTMGQYHPWETDEILADDWEVRQ